MSTGIQQHEWMIRTSSQKIIPAVMWVPSEADRTYPLVMVCHGGSGHKTSDLVMDVVHALVEPFKTAVLAINGPWHAPIARCLCN